jgi:hypothetical protein
MNKGESVFEIYKNHWLVESNKASKEKVREKWVDHIHNNVKTAYICLLIVEKKLAHTLDDYKFLCCSIMTTFYEFSILQDERYNHYFDTIIGIPRRSVYYKHCRLSYSKEVFDRVWAYI